MTLTDELCGKMSDELQDAESYAKMAMAHREDHPELAKTLHEISLEELGHYNRLQAEAAKMAGEIRKMQESFEK